MPYLTDQMMRIGTYPHIQEVTHGGQKKTDRITWALEGRFEHGRILFQKDADYVQPLSEQLLDFPNPLAKDDLIDALAYIDQVAKTDYEPEVEEDEDWVDLEMGGICATTGY